MKIMSLNVWQGRLERVLLKHLEQSDLDFACMQEAVDYTGNSLGLVSSYQKVGTSAGLNEQFFSPLFTSSLGNRDISFGNVTYSCVPFTQTSTIFTRGDYNHRFNPNEDDFNIRAFQHVQIDMNGKTLHLLNHHGHHIDAHKLGDDETFRQVNQIRDYIRGLDGAVILCGDFNLAPESESIKLLDTDLTNLSVTHTLTTTRSNLTSKREVCDYIFVNDSVTVNDFKMDETIISDHNALVLDFDLV